MTNKYSVLVNYLGDGDFKFFLSGLGEITISKYKPIYISNADLNTIESLRVLKRMLIDITIGASPEGAYKVYDLGNAKSAQEKTKGSKVDYDRRGQENIDNNEINSILKAGTSGPITLDSDSIVNGSITLDSDSIMSITPVGEDEIIDENNIVEEVIIDKPKKKNTKKTTKKKTKSSKK